MNSYTDYFKIEESKRKVCRALPVIIAQITAFLYVSTMFLVSEMIANHISPLPAYVHAPQQTCAIGENDNLHNACYFQYGNIFPCKTLTAFEILLHYSYLSGRCIVRKKSGTISHKTFHTKIFM